MFYDIKHFHFRLLKTLRFIGVANKVSNFAMEFCREVHRKHLRVTSLISNFHVSYMKLCNIINAQISRVLTC
jgi:hypothetical protein